jgi:hypothetical protein
MQSVSPHVISIVRRFVFNFYRHTLEVEMKKSQILLVLLTCIVSFSVSVNAQHNLQSKFDLLVPRQTNLEEVEKILGTANSRTFVYQWRGKLRKDGSFDGFDYNNSTNCRNDLTYGFVTRNLYRLDYPQLGVTVTILDNPWTVLSVAANTAEVSLMNLKVGDQLDEVKKVLGKGQWQTSDGSDFWNLTFEKKGVRVSFQRDANAPQFPMKLATDAVVVKIEKFDEKSSFIGCGKDDPSYRPDN